MSEDEKYMARCIQLARCGRFHAAPNPMVGAVVVCDGRIIGEGYHIRCGTAHAEVNAVSSVSPEDEPLLSRSTIYVSLEPCSHYGKTPPCADLIIRTGIPRVVIGCIDPFSEVSGRGVEKLRSAGIEVVVGVLEEKCRELNRWFMTSHLLKRPYVILKWAQSADGFMDRSRSSADEMPVSFSNGQTGMLTHRLRAAVQAILVGRRTALLDNPSLTVRRWAGESPIRLVIDRHLTLPSSLHLFDGSVPTMVFTETLPAVLPNSMVEYVALDFSVDILPQLLSVLYTRNIQSVLVEGGATLLQKFIDIAVWDEAFVESSPIKLSSGVGAPCLPMKLLVGREEYAGNWRSFYRHG